MLLPLLAPPKRVSRACPSCGVVGSPRAGKGLPWRSRASTPPYRARVRKPSTRSLIAWPMAIACVARPDARFAMNGAKRSRIPPRVLAIRRRFPAARLCAPASRAIFCAERQASAGLYRFAGLLFSLRLLRRPAGLWPPLGRAFAGARRRRIGRTYRLNTVYDDVNFPGRDLLYLCRTGSPRLRKKFSVATLKSRGRRRCVQTRATACLKSKLALSPALRTAASHHRCRSRLAGDDGPHQEGHKA